MTLEMIEKELRRHPLWEREIPIQMQTGIPYLYMENGALYLKYLLHRRIFRPGRVLIFPDRYELELLLPDGKIVCFRDLRREPTGEPDRPVCVMEPDYVLEAGKMALAGLYAHADRVLGFTGSKKELETLVSQYQDQYRKTEEILRPDILYGG